jgi:hypothetical protein
MGYFDWIWQWSDQKSLWMLVCFLLSLTDRNFFQSGIFLPSMRPCYRLLQTVDIMLCKSTYSSRCIWPVWKERRTKVIAHTKVFQVIEGRNIPITSVSEVLIMILPCFPNSLSVLSACKAWRIIRVSASSWVLYKSGQSKTSWSVVFRTVVGFYLFMNHVLLSHKSHVEFFLVHILSLGVTLPLPSLEMAKS